MAADSLADLVRMAEKLKASAVSYQGSMDLRK